MDRLFGIRIKPSVATSVVSEPLVESELNSTELSHGYDQLLPPSTALRQSVVQSEFSSIHKIILVEQNSPDIQLGFIVLERLNSNELWRRYMKSHRLENLWIDRRDLTSLVQHRGIGTALWNISHKVITPGEHRAIIDTSNGWTHRKIDEAKKKGIFEIIDVDKAENYAKMYKRYLVKYDNPAWGAK